MARQIINTGSVLNDPTAEHIRSAFTKVNDMTNELYGGVASARTVHNVLDYGALGNSQFGSGGGADDTAEIQTAYDAAFASGGVPVVVFPSHRTFRITSTINVWPGVHTKGLGGLDGAGTNTPAMIMWDGAAWGTILRVSSSSTTIANTYFENVCLTACNASSNQPAVGIEFLNTGGTAAMVDSGCGCRNVQFLGMQGGGGILGAGIAFINGGSTNFFIEGGRFDGLNNAYGIYCELGSFLGVILGNTNYVGGGGTNGKGFVFMDGELAGSGGSSLYISGLHTEINTSLEETFAAGANPYDKRGILRFGVDPAHTSLQHRVYINSWMNNYSGGLDSFCGIQLTSTSGTDAEISDSVYVGINHAEGLSSGTTDAGTTSEVRMFGGKVPANRRFPFNSARTGSVNWGYGKNSYGDGVRSYWNHRHGSIMMHGFGLQPETFNDLDQYPVAGGGMAFITDCNSTTVGAVPAGGGANKVLVMHNGTDWRILQKVQA